MIIRQRISLLIPDASPLISLGQASVTSQNGTEYLDLLLKAGLPVYVTDQVRWEATRLKAFGHPIASHVERWFERHPEVENVTTKIGKMREAAENAGTLTQDMLVDQGEESVLQAIRAGLVPAGPYLFLFEEDRLADPSFFGVYPVHVISLYGFLVGLERAKLVSSADMVLQSIRSSGRKVKADIIDRPTRKVETPAEESEWIPPKP
ncbi:hypothetical protein [Bradyrhizobium sp. Ce-3]|uniref:hypothetical protein n=1 Tax=Bradyrhizobium sp. Ce-3 TaxID=2913970 RepID=UPI001FC82974|nr:hypothetical protein [Bradyrhizobium sp. Ce-3]GKQ53498.1 hypothetical protein BRSPCE3_43530 [Bradyrhizobium sp. Ce-3]